jgi:uncharacterized membrane protein
MVTLHEHPDEALLIAQPNNSANWQLNKLIIAALVLWWGLLAGFLALRGLWPIIPFAGLEVGGLALALYYASWKLQQRHVLRFSNQLLTLQKGAYHPSRTWQFARDSASLSIEVQAQPWDPLKLFLCDRNQQIPIGNFLNRDDSDKLLALLRAQGLAVRNHSVLTHLEL